MYWNWFLRLTSHVLAFEYKLSKGYLRMCAIYLFILFVHSHLIYCLLCLASARHRPSNFPLTVFRHRNQSTFILFSSYEPISRVPRLALAVTQAHTHHYRCVHISNYLALSDPVLHWTHGLFILYCSMLFILRTILVCRTLIFVFCSALSDPGRLFRFIPSHLFLFVHVRLFSSISRTHTQARHST